MPSTWALSAKRARRVRPTSPFLHSAPIFSQLLILLHALPHAPQCNPPSTRSSPKSLTTPSTRPHSICGSMKCALSSRSAPRYVVHAHLRVHRKTLRCIWRQLRYGDGSRYKWHLHQVADMMPCRSLLALGKERRNETSERRLYSEGLVATSNRRLVLKRWPELAGSNRSPIRPTF